MKDYQNQVGYILRDHGDKVPASFYLAQYDTVLYLHYYHDNRKFPIWNEAAVPGTGPFWAVMQDDGNFCLKLNGDINASPVWGTGVTDSLDKNNSQFTEIVYDFKNKIVKPNGEPKHSSTSTAINKTDINQ